MDNNSTAADACRRRQIVLIRLEEVERGGIVCAVCFLVSPMLLVFGAVILALGLETVVNWRLTLTLAAALAVALLVLAIGFFILLVGLKGRAILRPRRRRLRRQLAETARPV